MKIERVRARRTANGVDQRAWCDAIREGAWVDSSTLLKRDGASWVRRASVRGRDVVIKCRPAAGVGERFKRLARSTRGDRQWRGAQWLARHGFDTASPLLLAAGVVEGVPVELLVTEHVNASSVFDLLARGGLSARRQHAVARSLARLIADMAGAGRFNRDGKPSNLLAAHGNEPRIVTIDCVAIRPASVDVVERSLANLVIEPIGSGFPPRLALRARVVREIVGAPPRGQARGAWKRRRDAIWRRVEGMVAAHGDPRPRVNPLSAPPPAA